MRLRYGLIGVMLSGFLVASVLFLRHASPRVFSEANSPRSKGAANAPIQIIEYSDFQCPACKNARSELYDLLEEYPGKIRLVYHHFPLQGHAWARAAHQAAECAARQGRFWPYHDRLYSGQSEWSKLASVPIETFIEYAKEVGLDLDRFGQCLSDPEVGRKIQAEKIAGEGLGIRSTPSFFVNGELLVGISKLRDKVESLLQR